MDSRSTKYKTSKGTSKAASQQIGVGPKSYKGGTAQRNVKPERAVDGKSRG